MLRPRRAEFDASKLAVKMSAAGASGTPLICCSCFLSSSVRILPKDASAASSDFVTVSLVLSVRDVRTGAIRDIFSDDSQSVAHNLARSPEVSYLTMQVESGGDI